MQKKKFDVWLIIAAACFWGTAGIYVRSLAKFNVSNMMTVFLRSLFTVLILTLIVLFKDPKLFRINPKDIWLFVVTGIFSIVMFNYCYYKTMSLSSLSVAAVLLYTSPFFVIAISVPLFKEKFTLKKAVACVVAFIGCLLVSGLSSSGFSITPTCLVFGLLTGFGYALYTIFSEILLKRGYPSITITFYTFLFAFLGTIPLLGQELGKLVEDPFSVVPVGALPIAVAMAAFNTVLPYLLYTSGLKTVAPDRAQIIATVEPVMATVIGLTIFHEFPKWTGWLGIVLVIGSVVFLNLKPGEKT